MQAVPFDYFIVICYHFYSSVGAIIKIRLCSFFLFLLTFAALLPADTEQGRREMLIKELRSREIPFEERPLLENYGGFGASIHVLLPPLTAETPGGNPLSFMLAVPLRGSGASPDEQAEGLSFGIETALYFIDSIRRHNTAMEIRIAFLGDEFSRLPADSVPLEHLGLRDLCALPEIPENVILWYLDIEKAPAQILIHHGAEKKLAPLSMIQDIPELSASVGVPYSLAIHFNEIYKLGLAEGPSALSVTGDRGINALYITSLKGRDGEKNIGPPALAELIAAYTASFTLHSETQDTHFSIISTPFFSGKIFFISEQATVVLLFLALAAFLLYQGIISLLRRKTIIIRRIVFIRRFWVILAFIAILTISFLIAAFFFNILCRIFAVSPPQSYGVAALVFIFALVLSSVFSFFIDRISIPYKDIFYGNASLFLISAGIFIAAVLNITFVPVFVWAFLFILIGSLVKIPALVYVSALITPLQALAAFINLLNEGNMKLTRSFLEGNFFICLYIALICMPFILIIKRGNVLLWRRRRRLSFRWNFLPRPVLAAFSIIVLVIYLWRSSASIPLPPERRTLEASAEVLDLRLSGSAFLESRILGLQLKASGNPVRFDIYLENAAPSPPEIYSAQMPVEAAGENSLRLILGEDPPNPLSAELVLPLKFSGAIRAEALYTVYDPGIDPMPPPPGADYLLKLVRTLPVGDIQPE
ncbi:hypothetical protein AGMMS49928_21670 [Spirochaetia bacterium]|nr:hypothetical protein AGMMS49928_21670 [Spirochaetia bacterium]